MLNYKEIQVVAPIMALLHWHKYGGYVEFAQRKYA